MTTASQESRTTELDAWLSKHEARCMWQIVGHRAMRHTVECWAFPTARPRYKSLAPVMIVIRYHGGGWDIFLPGSETIGIKETLADVEARMGLMSD